MKIIAEYRIRGVMMKTKKISNDLIAEIVIFGTLGYICLLMFIVGATVYILVGG